MPLASRLAQSGVLASAMTVFEKRGFAQARVEDILEAAGIARRTFYRYFKSKDEVLAAIYEMAVGEILSALAGVENERDPVEGLLRGIDVYLDYHVKNAATLRVLIGQSMRPDSPLYPMRQTFRGTLVGIMDGVAREKGKHLAPYVFLALISALEGLSLELLQSGVKKADLEIARQTIAALLANVFDVPGPALPRSKK
ncbi:MAG: TetR/AcrR family transcriptional regulator [Polyangiaceae bacterium]